VSVDTECRVVAYGHLDPWYSSSWSYRRQIIIDHSEVSDVADPSTTYAGFPVYVHATGLSNIKADGVDVRFTDSAGTELPREIEKYASGTLDAWVKFTLTKDAGDSSDDVIYMYYGNTDATEPAEDATYGRENVWDDNFVMVQHMQEDPTGGATPDTTDEIFDSTQYDNDGNTGGTMLTEDQVAGQIDGSLDFDGGDDYINIDNDASLQFNGGVFSFSAWMNVHDVNIGTKTIVSKDDMNYGDQFPWIIRLYEDDVYYTVVDNGGTQRTVKGASVLSVDTLCHLTATFDPTGYSRLYVDGLEVSSVDISGFTFNDTSGTFPLRLGILSYSAVQEHYGIIDEVRISNVARTAGWIETEYNNQSDVSTFLTINAEEDNTPTEFISKIRSSGGDYTLLSAWEDEVECDLTATTTRVFSGALTLGALSENDLVELYRGGVDQGVDALKPEMSGAKTRATTGPFPERPATSLATPPLPWRSVIMIGRAGWMIR